MPTTMMQVSQPVTHSFDNTFKQYQPSEPPMKLGPKVNPLGIEVIDSIVWQGWEPGREYTKNITLKNVKVKTQKIKYK